MVPKNTNQPTWFLNQEKFLSETELHRLLRTVERRKAEALKSGRKTPIKDWFLICVATETGLRVQELSDLSCGDLQESGDWRVEVVRNGKGGKARVVSVRKVFMQQAREYIAWKELHGERVEKDAPLFTSSGKRICKRALQKSFERSMAKAGIERPQGIGIHSLRHTYASFLLKASKFNLSLVQKQLGHASVKTTEVYAHLFDAEVQKAVGRLYE